MYIIQAFPIKLQILELLNRSVLIFSCRLTTRLLFPKKGSDIGTNVVYLHFNFRAVG